MKSTIIVVPIFWGLVGMLISLPTKNVYSEEPGAKWKTQDVACVCNYGPHKNQAGKKKECSATATGSECTLTFHGTWDPQCVCYTDVYYTWETYACRYCTYPDCDGELCWLGQEPD